MKPYRIASWIASGSLGMAALSLSLGACDSFETAPAPDGDPISGPSASAAPDEGEAAPGPGQSDLESRNGLPVLGEDPADPAADDEAAETDSRNGLPVLELPRDPANEPAKDIDPDELVEVPREDPAGQPVDTPVEDPPHDPALEPQPGEFVLLDELDPLELERIEELRTAIFDGLDRGRDHYLESVALILHMNGVVADYETVLADGWQTLQQGLQMSQCPFAQYYDNAEVQTVHCGYLAQLAQLEAYSALGALLDSATLPPSVSPLNLEEALFWQEQGAISGIEEQRVVVAADLAVQGFCNQVPKPVESSATKGHALGRQLIIDSLNSWLAKNGHAPDYPKMTSKIQVCAMNGAALNPARKAAKNAIADVLADEPLCPGYEPPTITAQLQFGQALVDYEAAISAGIDDEFALAAVKIFQVVPCNVSDPLVVDLDGDGFDLVNIARGVDFDLWETGNRQAVAWIGPSDAFLALDRDGSGCIEHGGELFGDIRGAAGDGFSDLALLDLPEAGGNGDGVIDARDAAFASLVLWQDRDSDGKCSPAELTSVADAGIVALPTTAAPMSLVIEGNPLAAMAAAQTEQGAVWIGDAFLRSAPYARLASR